MPTQVRIGWRSGSSSQTTASIVTSGLIMNLDAGNTTSYSGTGTTWTDLSSTGNNGTLVNGTGYSSSNGGALVFDGVNDYVNVANNPRINNTDFTYDFWFKVNSNTNTYQSIINQIDGNYVNYSAFGKVSSSIAQGSIAFHLQGFVLYSNLSGTDLITAGNINYIAIAKKEGSYYKLYLYRNGVLDNSLNTTLTSINMTLWNNFNTNIGRNSSAGGTYGDYLGGNIYVGRMYNRALSTTEITQNFDATKTRFGYSNLDTDAQAFLTAASIMDSTQASAVNTLVTQLKTYGIWSKLKAVYPFVGGNATSHKFNLKDPRDLDAAYRLVFSGGWVHSSTGAKPNGANGYADTKLNSSISLTTYSNHLSFYSRTSTGYPSEFSLGVGDNYGRYAQALVIRRDNNLSAYDSGSSTSANRITYSNTDGSGFYLGITLANNNRKYYRNNITMVSSTSVLTQDLANANVFLGAYNEYNITGANYYTNKETAFASIGDGLTDAEALAFYTAVQTFQTTLGRHVGVPIVADTDAQAFLNAAVITDSTQASAVNTLVTSLKTAGIWTKMKAIYPFVGGTATSHKFNLKDPRDVDAAFRLVFNGGWVHSSTGAKPNGTTGYANTFLTPSTSLALGSSHMSFYSRTNTTINGIDFGAEILPNSSFYGIIKNLSNNAYIRINRAGSPEATTPMSNSNVFFIANRASSISGETLYVNSTKPTLTNAGNANGIVSIPLFIGCLNDNGNPAYYTNRESAFSSIGDGLTDAEALAFYNAVQAFQTTLGRQV